MKCSVCALAVTLLPAPIYSQEWRVIESGLYTGWDQKAFERVGDLGSVAIVRALPKNSLVNPTQMRSALT
jgi:hypothetical protein